MSVRSACRRARPVFDACTVRAVACTTRVRRVHRARSGVHNPCSTCALCVQRRARPVFDACTVRAPACMIRVRRVHRPCTGVHTRVRRVHRPCTSVHDPCSTRVQDNDRPHTVVQLRCDTMEALMYARAPPLHRRCAHRDALERPRRRRGPGYDARFASPAALSGGRGGVLSPRSGPPRRPRGVIWPSVGLMSPP